MKKLIIALLVLAAIFAAGPGFAQTSHHKAKKQKAAAAPCAPAPKKSVAVHHRKPKHHMAHKTHEPQEMPIERMSVDNNSTTALVEIKNGSIYVNDNFLAKIKSLKNEDQQITINYIVPPPPPPPPAPAPEPAAVDKTGKAMLGVYTCGYCGAGAVIEDVAGNSPADKAGLYDGDVITKIDDRDISSPEDLEDAIDGHKPGDNISLTYEHCGKTHTVQLELDEQPKEENCECPGMYGYNDYWHRNW